MPPALCHGGRRVEIGTCADRDWDAIRAEYVAGDVSQDALAQKHGVSLSALKRRARTEGWAALKADAANGKRRGDGATATRPGKRSGSGKGSKGDAEIAVRVRRKLLLQLEKVADGIPHDATELKTQDDSAVKLFKLRDLTAAYKELTGDMQKDDGAEEESRVIIDV